MENFKFPFLSVHPRTTWWSIWHLCAYYGSGSLLAGRCSPHQGTLPGQPWTGLASPYPHSTPQGIACPPLHGSPAQVQAADLLNTHTLVSKLRSRAMAFDIKKDVGELRS